jgi:hypothetical protein
MVGITMALAIAILIFGAAGLFAWLSRPFSDLIPMVAPAAEIAAPEAEDEPVVEAPVVQQEQEATEPEQNSAPAEVPTIAAAAPESEEEQEAFEPTHQIAAAGPVNLRPDPSVNNTPIIALPPETPLQYLDEDAPTTDTADGARWMRFRTEDGQEGWVREIDTGPYQP